MAGLGRATKNRCQKHGERIKGCGKWIKGCGKRLALGTPHFPTVQENPTEQNERVSNGCRIFFFYLGALATLAFMAYIVQHSFETNVLHRIIRSYEVKTRTSLPFPNICVCNNYDDSSTSGLYPKDKGCTVFKYSFSISETPCSAPYIQKDMHLANTTCIVYGNQTAFFLQDSLRIRLDVGNTSSIPTPWTGGFLLLAGPGEIITEETLFSGRWYLLSANTYYSFHLEMVLVTDHLTDNRADPLGKGIISYNETQSPDSAPLGAGHKLLNGSNVIVDFYFRTFRIKHHHEYPVRTPAELLVDLGGAKGWFGIAILVGGVVASLTQHLFGWCKCRRAGGTNYDAL
jgi:hypothetical protein